MAHDKEVFKYAGNTNNHEISVESELEWIKKIISKKNDYHFAIIANGEYLGKIYLSDIKKIGEGITYLSEQHVLGGGRRGVSRVAPYH